MRHINIAQLEFELFDDDAPPGFRAGVARLGVSLGAEKTGVSIYDLAPGEMVCPYHYDLGDEEWLLVLAGNPTLRHPDGFEQLDPLDVVFFPLGPEGAHGIRNERDDPARVAMFSTTVRPKVTIYPDTNKVGVWTEDSGHDLVVRRDSSIGYYDGER